jgi:hypothetical protein
VSRPAVRPSLPPRSASRQPAVSSTTLANHFVRRFSSSGENGE